MKILLLVDSYPPHHGGGYELRCKDVVNGLMSRGHNIHIITTRCTNDHCGLHPNEGPVDRILHRKSQASSLLVQILRDFSDMWFIDHTTRSFKPDLVYLWHLGDLSNAIIPYFASSKIPMVYDEGGKGLIATARILKRGLYFFKNENDSSLKKWAKKTINTLVDFLSGKRICTNATWPDEMKIIFNSQHSLDYAQQNGVPVQNAKVIYSGIDVGEFQYLPRNGLDGRVKFLVPGRITPIKGTKDALSLFDKLNEAGIPSHLTIIGRDFSNTYFDEIQQVVEQMDHHDISLLPMTSQEELANLYQTHDICFFPSHQENGLSRVPLEAMACGCLVLSYGNEASNEVITNGINGFIISEGDISEAVKIIKSLLNDPEQVKQITQYAHETIQQYFTLERYIRSVELFLKKSAPVLTDHI